MLFILVILIFFTKETCAGEAEERDHHPQSLPCPASMVVERNCEKAAGLSVSKWEAKAKVDMIPLFRIDGKNLMLGTCHCVPPSFFSEEARELLGSCDFFFSEAFPTGSEESLKLSFFIKKELTKFLQKLKEKFPYKGRNWLDLIDSRAFKFPIIEDLFPKEGLDICHPFIFYVLLRHHETFDKVLIEQLREIEEEEESNHGGMDEVLEGLYLKKDPEKVFGLESFRDWLFVKAFLPQELQSMEALITCYLSCDPMNYPYKVTSKIVSDINRFVANGVTKEENRRKKASRDPFIAGNMDAFEIFCPFVPERIEEDIHKEEEAAGEEQGVVVDMHVLPDSKTASVWIPSSEELKYVEIYCQDFASLKKSMGEYLLKDSREEAQELVFRNNNMFCTMVSDLAYGEMFRGAGTALYTMGAAHLFGETGMLRVLVQDSHKLEIYSQEQRKFVPFEISR